MKGVWPFYFIVVFVIKKKKGCASESVFVIFGFPGTPSLQKKKKG